MHHIASNDGSNRTDGSRLIRHAVASLLLLTLLAPLGTAALMQGRAASKGIALDEQENFSAYRSASSEAGR